ncbi:MAG TPA: ABC transporter permease [Gemmatimonadaceae bacterium]|nr:ABC transporter permease [Gemmatimonadaceae bacterium]
MRKLEWGIAWRYLRSRSESRLLSFISVIAIGGVLVGVSALIVTIGVMDGMQTDLRDKILVGSPALRVLRFGSDLTLPDWQVVLQRVRKTPGIVAAAPFVTTKGVVSGGHDFTDGAVIMGIEPDSSSTPEVTSIRRYAVEKKGDFRFITSSGERAGVVVGQPLADRLAVNVGDTIRLLGLAGNAARIDPITGQPAYRLRRYEVTGIFRTGMYEYDNTYIYMSLSSARDFAGLGNAVTGIEARTSDLWDAPAVRERLEESLGLPYRVEDWQQTNASLFHALKLEKLGMGIILLLIVLVAAFNIVSTLTMVVKDKTREIGILKAMGLPARSVQNIFVVQGLVIGLVGTLSGLTLGVIAALALDRWHLIHLDPTVYFIDHLPVSLNPLDLTWIIVASIAIAALATLHPARQAAKLYPVEAIRHE